MNKLISVIVLTLYLFYPFSTRAELIKVDTCEMWHLGVVVGPAMNYRNIVINTNSAQYFNPKYFQDTTQEPRFNLNAGIIFRKKIGKKIRFETGVVLSNKGYQSREYVLTEDIPTYSGYTRHIYKIKDNYNFWYLDLPFKFHYQINRNENKINFNAGLGIIFNQLLSAHNDGTISEINQNGNFVQPNLFYRTDINLMPRVSGFSGISELEVRIPIKKASLSISTFYERSLIPVEKVGDYFYTESLYLYSYGIGLGYFQKF